MLGWFILLAWDYEAQHVFLVSGFSDPSDLCPLEQRARLWHPEVQLVRVSRVLLQSEEPAISESAGSRRAQGLSGHQASSVSHTQRVF